MDSGFDAAHRPGMTLFVWLYGMNRIIFSSRAIERPAAGVDEGDRVSRIASAQRARSGRWSGIGPRSGPRSDPWRLPPQNGVLPRVLLSQAGPLWNFWQVCAKPAEIRSIGLS
jgi:hypothetical protein